MINAATVSHQFECYDKTPGEIRTRHSFLNAVLDTAWRKQWLQRPTLEPASLTRCAEHTAALDDWGQDNGWHRRLDILTQALHSEACLTPLGRTIAHGQLVSALTNRLRATALWKRHPEILDQPLDQPIIIVGQMRSGSTRIQRLLACDPRLTFTKFFEGWNPVHARPLGRLIDDRLLRGWIGLRFAHLLNPNFRVSHPTGTNQPDEEIGLHNISVFGSAFEAQWRVPSFVAEGETCDTREVYLEFRRLLQTIAWLRGKQGNRPYVLKVPQFTQDLTSVLSVFPDAKLVCLQRDNAALIASSAALVHDQMIMQSDRVDRRWIGRQWLNKVVLRHQRTEAALGASDAPRVIVPFSAMQEDWRQEMHKVYRMLGLPLLPEVEATMQRYLARVSRSRLAQRTYKLADFGLSNDDVCQSVGGSLTLPDA